MNSAGIPSYLQGRRPAPNAHHEGGPDPVGRVRGALGNVRERIRRIEAAAQRLVDEPLHRRQVAHAVDLVEQGRECVSDLLELVAAASVVLYRGREAA